MPGWKGSQLIGKSRIDLGFTECPSQSVKIRTFYNEQGASIDANSAMAGQENAVLIKLSNGLLSVHILALFHLDSSTYLSALFSSLSSSSCLPSFHCKSAKGSLQSTIFSFLSRLTEMQLGSTGTSLRAGQTALCRVHSTTEHPCLRRHTSPAQQPASFPPHWTNVLLSEKSQDSSFQQTLQFK